MSNTLQKEMTVNTQDTAIKHVYNDVDKTLSVNGFLVSKVGAKVTATVTTTNVANDTIVFNFFDGTNPLYTITVVYTDGSRSDLLSASRTA